MRSRKLKALSYVHSTCLGISLKMALQIGSKHVAGHLIGRFHPFTGHEGPQGE